MIRKKGTRVPKLQLAKEYLSVYPSASNQQVVDALDVSERIVSAARSFLVQTEVIQKSFYARRPDTATPGSRLAITEVSDLAANEAVLTDVVNFAGMDTAEQRQRLAALARKAHADGSGQLEIAAIQAIAKLDQATGTRDKLGPGPPLTREDKVQRLGVLIEVCGPSIVAEAIIQSFSRDELYEYATELVVFRDRKAKDGSRTQENQAPAAEGPPPAASSNVPE